MQTEDQGILKDFGITQTDPPAGAPLTNWLMKGCQNCCGRDPDLLFYLL